MPFLARGADRAQPGWADLLVIDFCPWANRYVYWLKEPIGWFVAALAISLLVGLYVSSVGWVLASMIFAVIVAGMVWPWCVVRAARCRLRPSVPELHEGQSCDLILVVANRFPIPLWGISVEGYLDRRGDDVKPSIALACVPPCSDAEYRLRVAPKLRGRYPEEPPSVSCSMPFGLWTARRRLAECAPLVVFPEVSRVQDDPELASGVRSESGDGLRTGESGEPLGVRAFRSGDRLRNVHWIHTARTGNLTVCERGGPQRPEIAIELDTSLPYSWTPVDRDCHREALARRVRVAASVAVALHARHLPLRLVIGRDQLSFAPGASGRRKLLTALMEVPIDGCFDTMKNESSLGSRSRTTVRISGSSASAGAVRVQVDSPRSSRLRESRRSAIVPSVEGLLADSGDFTILAEAPLGIALSRFWREVRHVDAAA